MAEFDIGQTFFDKKAVNLDHQKGKYFIALSSAEDLDDEIVCFVMNTETRMDRYKVGCNKNHDKYIIEPGTFSFIKKNTSIMLAQPARYFLYEIYGNDIILYEKADSLLCRQIKNCLNWNNIIIKFAKLIKESFKLLK